MTPPRRYLLVDGHSILFHLPHYHKLHSQNQSSARDLLARELQQLHDFGGWLVTLVFDGRGLDQPARRPADMAIIYSNRNQTADSIIERLVGAQKDRARITVVTADEAERLTVEALGAHSTTPQWLQMELEKTAGELRETIKKAGSKRNPSTI